MAKTTKTDTKAKTEAPQVENTQPEAAPIATLLSSISYTNQEDYNNFLANLTPEHAVIVLISAANHCQARGIFNLDEAELLAKAIKALTPSQQPQAQ
jgi:hypothetical protein